MSESASQQEEEAPIFGSWAGLYCLVIGNLVMMMGLFYFITLRYT